MTDQVPTENLQRAHAFADAITGAQHGAGTAGDPSPQQIAADAAAIDRAYGDPK